MWDRCKIDDRGAGCWNWTGKCSSSGYGTFKRGHKTYVVHRATWAAFFGAIPKGMIICHRCDNRKCFNPSHLFLGTHADNMADMRAKGRDKSPRAPGASNPGAKLTATQVAEIKLAVAAGENRASIAVRYGVTRDHVGRLINGRYWK